LKLQIRYDRVCVLLGEFCQAHQHQL